MLHRRRGFTLIELLVVVAIIALLIAILLPSLGRAKANAVRVKCAAVLKQWGMVVQLYAQENNDLFGYEAYSGHYWTSISTGSTSEMYDPEWATSGGPSGFKYSAGLHTCPGDPSFGLILSTTNQATNNFRPPVDYAMVRYYPIVSNKTMWKMSECSHPSSTLLICDAPPTIPGAAYSFTTMDDLNGVAPEVLTQSLQKRHMGVGNVAFLDGHVEQHGYQDFVANIPTTKTDYSRIWTFINLP
jgi:prepilin-type N-terminal cleavage/methylation domain-containing protein/prepilin-type processing-associated H-X9-DG protein